MTSLYTLSLLFMSFAGNGEYKVIAARAPVVAWAAMEAVRLDGPVFDEDEDGEKTMSLLTRIAYLESRGNHKAFNMDGGDAGITQVRGLSLVELALVLSSPTEGMRAGLRRLKAAKTQCGGKAIRWIGGYASGTCGGAPKIAALRCQVLGLCEMR